VPLFDIMAILGHSSPAVTQRYIHPDLGNLRKAMGQVDAHWRELEA
jgi:integrase